LLGGPAPAPKVGPEIPAQGLDAKRKQFKAKTRATGTYVDTVKQVLSTYAAAAHHDAQLEAAPHPSRVRSNYANHVVRVKAGKTQLFCVSLFLDEYVFKPVALIEKCLLVGTSFDDDLPTLALTRIALTSKVGRKAFVTLKLAQSVPRITIMQATGHRTESSFNRYVGIDEAKLVENYRKTARQVAKEDSPALPPDATH
jgi:hypothetical protein